MPGHGGQGIGRKPARTTTAARTTKTNRRRRCPSGAVASSSAAQAPSDKRLPTIPTSTGTGTSALDALQSTPCGEVANRGIPAVGSIVARSPAVSTGPDSDGFCRVAFTRNRNPVQRLASASTTAGTNTTRSGMRSTPAAPAALHQQLGRINASRPSERSRCGKELVIHPASAAFINAKELIDQVGRKAIQRLPMGCPCGVVLECLWVFGREIEANQRPHLRPAVFGCG